MSTTTPENCPQVDVQITAAAPVEAEGKAPRSEAQRIASIENGRKSGGPREGRAVSRLNATRHGLAARTPEAMPPALRAECARLERAYIEAYRPRDDQERQKVRQAAQASARRDWIHGILMARADDRRGHALDLWDERRQDEVADHLARLAARPAATVRALRATSDGCAAMVDLVDALAQALEAEGGWTAERLLRARRLLGLADDAPDPDRYERPFTTELLDLGRRLLLDADGRPAEGPKADAARARLLALLGEMAEELDARCQDLTERHDGPDRQSAPVLAELDLSPEGRLLFRYLSAAIREEQRALAELRAGRGEASPSTRLPSSPSPSSSPAQSSPSRSGEPRLRVGEIGLGTPSRSAAPNEPGASLYDSISPSEISEYLAFLRSTATATAPPSGRS